MAKRDRPAPLFHVPEEMARQTLAAAIKHWRHGESWGDVKKLIASRRVTVNGNLCMDAARRLRGGEAIKVLEMPSAAPPTADSVRIVFLDEHVVVVDKPPGMTSVPHANDESSRDRRQFQPTLLELLPRILAKVDRKRSSKGPPRVKAVHRIDRETSGLMVFARTPQAERKLVEQFRMHSTERSYLAIVLGSIESQTIESRLVRDRGDGRRGSTPDASLGRLAITHVERLQGLPGYTFIRCRLETGRTHQIRIHLAEAGHPLCGEKVYLHQPKRKTMRDSSGAPRVALHAAEIGFEHPVTGGAMRFESPFPSDLQSLLKRLKAPRPKGQSLGE